jgi:hypothetical protein
MLVNDGSLSVQSDNAHTNKKISHVPARPSFTRPQSLLPRWANYLLCWSSGSILVCPTRNLLQSVGSNLRFCSACSINACAHTKELTYKIAQFVSLGEKNP